MYSVGSIRDPTIPKSLKCSVSASKMGDPIMQKLYKVYPSATQKKRREHVWPGLGTRHEALLLKASRHAEVGI